MNVWIDIEGDIVWSTDNKKFNSDVDWDEFFFDRRPGQHNTRWGHWLILE